MWSSQDQHVSGLCTLTPLPDQATTPASLSLVIAVHPNTGPGPYNCFVTEHFKEVASRMPHGSSRQDTTKQLVAMWHRLPEEGRKPYRDLFAKRQETETLLDSVVSLFLLLAS